MSANKNQIYFADEEQAGGKLGRKARESPFMVIGEKIVMKVENFPQRTMNNDIGKILKTDEPEMKRILKNLNESF